METTIPDQTSINDYTLDQPQPPKQPSSKPLISGIFLIIAGLLGLLTWASALALDISMIQNVLPPESPITAEQLQSFLTTCGIIGAILSIFTLAGGIVAMRRKAWGLAVIGGILGLFTIGPMLLGSILSLIGLIILIISRSDFQ
ncbi:MAG: hypothetical protein MUC80_05345 [Candidatus Thermoplasmatota archaeon]|jgi:hypothetical protein|nr:hypothetical protein [Candidatus Thermoplasmatota archaeon]